MNISNEEINRAINQDYLDVNDGVIIVTVESLTDEHNADSSD